MLRFPPSLGEEVVTLFCEMKLDLAGKGKHGFVSCEMVGWCVSE
jgi:hypothetical protein